MKNLKLVNITPFQKEGKNYIKCNYRLVSILPNLSKIFAKFIYTEIS